MQERIPSDSGFVVEWQLIDDADAVIDLSEAQAAAGEPDPVAVGPPGRAPIPR